MFPNLRRPGFPKPLRSAWKCRSTGRSAAIRQELPKRLFQPKKEFSEPPSPDELAFPAAYADPRLEQKFPQNCSKEESLILERRVRRRNLMKLLRTTALTAALMTAAVPSLTTQANAQWGWRGGGWGWGGAALGIAAAGALIGTALAAPYYAYGYGYPAYGYGYPAYGYGYPAYGYGYPAYGYGYPAYADVYGYPGYGGYGYPGYGVYAYASVRRHPHAAAVGVRHYRHWR
jgi:hypothetical protein